MRRRADAQGTGRLQRTDQPGADVVAADVEAGRLALLPWPAGVEPARAKGSAYGLVSRAGRSLSPAAAVFVERVLEQERRFADA
ncbi:LysR family transcriptional regulator [Pseudomonas paraeruginosa]|nr:LysR family transcriptional regulator [Pseudomonas aeruginosa]